MYNWFSLYIWVYVEVYLKLNLAQSIKQERSLFLNLKKPAYLKKLDRSLQCYMEKDNILFHFYNEMVGGRNYYLDHNTFALEHLRKALVRVVSLDEM